MFILDGSSGDRQKCLVYRETVGYDEMLLSVLFVGESTTLVQKDDACRNRTCDCECIKKLRLKNGSASHSMQD